MGEYAPPVTRYGFYHCNGVFWPDVSNSNRHARANVSTLKSLLQPPTLQRTKSGQPSKRTIPPPPPDPAGHWYEAQLLHHGLNPSKNKQVAKKRLLEALEAGSLNVPTWIVTLEGELKKDWNTANKQAEARFKREKREREGSRMESKVDVARREYDKALREQEEAVKAERLAMGGSSSLTKKKATAKKDTSSQKGTVRQTSAKKAVVEKTSVTEMNKKPTTKKEPVKKDSKKPPPAKKGAIKKEPVKASAKRSYSEFAEGAETQKTSAPVRPKQTARRSNYSNFGSRPRPSIAHNMANPFKRENSLTGCDYNDMMNLDNSYPPSDSYYGKLEDEASQKDLKPEDDSDETDEDRELVVNGIYRIEAPEITSEFGHSNLRLILCLDGNVLWGAYNLGQFKGIIRAQPGPTEISRTPVSFLWRGYETGEGQMSFGPRCTGHISFPKGWDIQGSISVFGDIEFTGWRTPGPKNVSPRSAADMKREWDGYNQREYDRENTARWR